MSCEALLSGLSCCKPVFAMLSASMAALMNPHFAHVMPLHRFETISGCLRFVDALPAEGAPVPAGSDWAGQPRPNEPLYNRCFKVAPVLDAVLSQTDKLWNLGKDVSLDEMCVKSKGKLGGLSVRETRVGLLPPTTT
jgi:hypothetical protein